MDTGTSLAWRLACIIVVTHIRCLTRLGGTRADDVEDGASIAAAAEVAAT